MKVGKPIIQDYQGPRTAKGLVDAVKGLIPNHVKKVTDKDLDGWLKEDNDTAKAILFSDKGTISSLMKVLAAEFYGKIAFGQIRNKESSSISTFGITSYPTLLVLPGGAEPAVVYDGEMVKLPMQAFLAKYTSSTSSKSAIKEQKQKPLANEDTKVFTDSAQSASDASTFSEASASYATEEASSAAGSASTITIDLPTPPTESPDPIATPEDAATPAAMPDIAPPLATLSTQEELQAQCLSPKSPTCVLAFLPAVADTDSVLPATATEALASLSEIVEKHKQHGTKLFPFFAITASNLGSTTLREGLGLKGGDEVELIVVNGRRGWWKRYTGNAYGIMDVESWIDGIRLGEGTKERLPEGLVIEENSTTEEVPLPPVHEEL